jgi:hypothetical protein
MAGLSACKPGVTSTSGAAGQGFAKGGINDIVKNQVQATYRPGAKVTDVVLLAGYTFDVMDQMEKLILSYEGTTKKQIAIMEAISRGGQMPFDFRLPPRVDLANPDQVKACIQGLKHRIMAGLPITAGELRTVLYQQNAGQLNVQPCQFAGPYYNQFFAPPKPTSIYDLLSVKKIDSQPGDQELAQHIQRIKAMYGDLPTTDPFGYPFGPFKFGEPLRVPAELKEAFKTAVKNLTVDPILPDKYKNILRGLQDESFWGPYK